MFTLADLERLVDQWKLKLAQPDSDSYDHIYKDGVNDCLYDLVNLIDDVLESEERAYTYMNEIGG